MTPWTSEEFVERLRGVGRSAYHDKHPYHQLMNEGRLSPHLIRQWIANRFYYQKNIPLKDALLLSRCPVRAVRRVWIQRILDHDGQGDDPGGVENWLRLGEAAGLSRADLEQDKFLLPGVRFAVDAYLQLVATRHWTEGVASSLTELFAPDLMAQRLAAFERHYPWIHRDGLAYFRSRLTQARRDSDHGLAVVLEYCRARDQQEAAVAALHAKCQILWTQLDALAHAAREEIRPL